MKKHYGTENGKHHVWYLDSNTYEENFNILSGIESNIIDRLASYPNFNGIDFCDIESKGIQIRGHHINIRGYSYSDEVTINYDFSNSTEAIDSFCHKWIESDNDEQLNRYLSFIKECERYGWD